MAIKYLTLRAELVEEGFLGCSKCIFGIQEFDSIGESTGWYYCGIQNHPKFNKEYCANGYWKEIDLTK